MSLRRGLVVKGRKKGERGASLVEYALLVALIAVVCITAVTFLGTSGSAKIDKAGDGISSIPFDGQACPSGYDISQDMKTCHQRR
jgi:pilus assembly protein Flp/PilA